jgi:hypothetical protein
MLVFSGVIVMAGNGAEGAEMPVGPNFSGLGSGTVADPYQITNVDELQEMNLNISANYTLMNDIDAGVTSGWNSGAGFVPVGNDSHRFTGSLDGRNRTITGLYINRPGTDNHGLFGRADIGAVLKNLGLVDNNVSGSYYVGGLVGWNAGMVSNCYATGKVSGSGLCVGGLVGYNSGTVEKSYATGTVSGEEYV